MLIWFIYKRKKGSILESTHQNDDHCCSWRQEFIALQFPISCKLCCNKGAVPDRLNNSELMPFQISRYVFTRIQFSGSLASIIMSSLPSGMRVPYITSSVDNYHDIESDVCQGFQRKIIAVPRRIQKSKRVSFYQDFFFLKKITFWFKKKKVLTLSFCVISAYSTFCIVFKKRYQSIPVAQQVNG